MKFHFKKAQTAIEYMILLSLVAVIVMVSLSQLLPRANRSVKSLFSRARSSIMGENVRSIRGRWCQWGPCVNGTIQRLCDCPAPLGSGAVCPGSASMTANCEGGGDVGGDNGDNGDNGGDGDNDSGPGGDLGDEDAGSSSGDLE